MDLSLIISTYNRKEPLFNLLKVLELQTYDRFEVVVTDDGSSDGTVAMVERLAKHTVYPLRAVTQEKLGYRLARSRNNGAKLAVAPQLVFLDDDCLPNLHFLESYHRMYSPQALLKGDVLYVPSFDKLNQVLECFYGSKRPLRGGNFSISRDLFWSIGGFDEDFVDQAGEDTDLGRRLRLMSVPWVRVEGAHVYHAGLTTGGGGLPNNLYWKQKIHDTSIVRNTGRNDITRIE